MWRQQHHLSATNLHLVSEEEEFIGNGSMSNSSNLLGFQAACRQSSSLNLSRSSLNDLGRSSSVDTLHHTSNHRLRHATEIGNGSTMMNETFRIPYFAHTTAAAGPPAAATRSNPFAHLTAVGAVHAPLHILHHQRQQQQQQPPSRMTSRVSGGLGSVQSRHPTLRQASSSSLVAARAPLSIAEATPLGISDGSLSGASSSSSSDTMEQHAAATRKANTTIEVGGRGGHVVCIAPSPTPLATDNNNTNRSNGHPAAQTVGPSVLYRLIAAVGKVGGGGPSTTDWDAILQRARSHPHEACFFDPNAGGQVYALHRLLRRGESCCEDGDCCDSSSSSNSSTCRPPVAVVDAVIQACPRAVTRKQAVIDEDGILTGMDNEGGSNVGIMGGGNGAVVNDGNNNPMEWQAQAQHHQQQQQQQGQLFPPPNENLLLNFPPPPAAENVPAVQDAQQPPDDDDNNDDVRFEYPLAIACECEQDGEVVRLLASYLSTTQPVYRSEVFRSLDYASLPNPVVRILLEEYAGCVLERGMNSEATEGDDDDCPLEQVLFWWDDPDMMGMEEDIANYPDCNMQEDLDDLWEKLRMMLYAATVGTMGGYGKAKESFQVLHHILRIVSEGGIQEVRFPNDFAHAVLLLAKFIARQKGSSMFEERDECGSLPLHIAVSGKGLLQASATNYHSRTENKERNDERDEGNSQDEHNAQDNENADGEEAMEDDRPVGGNEAQQQQPNMPLLPLPELQVGAGPALAAAPQAEQGEDGDVNEPHQADEEDDEEEEDEDGDNDPDEDIDEASDMPSDMEIVRLLLAQHPASIRLRDSLTGSLPVHLALRNNPLAAEAIEHLIDLYPRSVTMPDGEGRLPLHTALIQESPTWEKVLDLSPRVLEARDPVTGLLPFQLAAMFKPKKESEDVRKNVKEEEVDRGQDLDSLTTAFRLLRRNPCLASGLGDVKPRPRSLIEQQIMVRHTPRVARLEEENERLRQKVEELECKLLSMQLMSSSASEPTMKKRKSCVSSC